MSYSGFPTVAHLLPNPLQFISFISAIYPLLLSFQFRSFNYFLLLSSNIRLRLRIVNAFSIIFISTKPILFSFIECYLTCYVLQQLIYENYEFLKVIMVILTYRMQIYNMFSYRIPYIALITYFEIP